MTDALTRLERLLGLPLRDPDRYRQALTHASYSHETGYRTPHNERLEFLGDAVLDLIIAEYLYERFPERSEGELSQMRAAVVRTSALAKVAGRLGLGDLLRLGAGEEASGGRRRPSVLADALEALIGALYLSEGLATARRFVLEQFREELAALEAEPLFVDHKTRLQELTQRIHQTEPRYRLVKAYGPDHAKTFEVDVFIKRKFVGRGTGRSKKEAEQRAAEAALQALTQES